MAHRIEIVFCFLPIYQLVMVKCQQSSEKHLNPYTTYFPCVHYLDNIPLPSSDRRRHCGRTPKHNAIIRRSVKSITSSVSAPWVTHKIFVVGVVTSASVSYLRRRPAQLLQLGSNYRCYDPHVGGRECVLTSSTSNNLSPMTRPSGRSTPSYE